MDIATWLALGEFRPWVDWVDIQWCTWCVYSKISYTWMQDITNAIVAHKNHTDLIKSMLESL